MSYSNFSNAFSDITSVTGCHTPTSRFHTHRSRNAFIENYEPQTPGKPASTSASASASASAVPPHGCSSLQDWTLPNLPRTNLFHHNCTVSSNPVIGAFETSLNMNGSCDIFQSGLYSVPPSVTESLLSGNFHYEFNQAGLITQFVELKSSPSSLSLRGYSMLGHDKPTEHGNSNGGKSSGIVQENRQITLTESCPCQSVGLRTRIPEIDVRQRREGGFGVFNLEPLPQYSTQPPLTGIQRYFEDTDELTTSPPSYSLFRDDEDIPSEAYGVASLSARTYQTREPLVDKFVKSNSSSARKRDFPQIETESETSSPFKKIRRVLSYREIASKDTLSSQKVVAHSINLTDSPQPRSKKRGRRHKPLGPEKSKKVTDMREMRACASCFISHLECSKHPVCLKCKKRSEKSAIESPSCLRGPLQFWKELFFPSLLSGHITHWFLNDWIKEHGVTFTEHHILVALSSDPFGFTLPLVVHEISAVKQECLLVSDLAARPEDESNSFAAQYTLPYGYNGDIEQLQRRCLQYVNVVSKHSLCDIEDVVGDTSGIVWKALKAARSFDQVNPVSKKDGVILKGINVFWMDYMMDRSFAFSYDSAMKALQSFHDPTIIFPETLFISAALLSKQVKLAIHLKLEAYIGDLLENLERHSRRTRASWVQIATDATVVDLVSKGQDGAHTRKKGIQICQALEDLPMKYSWTLFHGVQSKHNPIKNGCPISNNGGQNEGEAELINAIRQLKHDHGNRISQPIREALADGQQRKRSRKNQQDCVSAVALRVPLTTLRSVLIILDDM